MRRLPPSVMTSLSPRALPLRALAAALLLAGCGGAAVRPAPPPAASEPAPAVSAAPAAAPGTIGRAALDLVLDGGLGRFLGRVETEPARENGQFVGFRVVSLEGPLVASDPTGSGLRVGDVVVRVNGQVIERPEQALTVWEGLRVASTLAIEYLRAGQRREARFEIVN